jgi:hypothetical protein
MRYLLLGLLLGCGDASDSGGGTDGDADTDTDTDTDTETGCTPLTEGPWTADGSCFGMVMSATLTVGTDGCSFTFSDWDMAMSVPEGGTVAGSDIALTGANWDDCTGTTDGTSMQGTCGDGCAFTMESGGM